MRGDAFTTLAIAALAASSAFCGVLWQADPAQGTDQFKVINIEGNGKITPDADPQYGPMWRFFKPGSGLRTEAHGAKGIDSREGDLIYIGWTSKLSMPQNTTLTAIFQFKSYPPGNGANFPLLLRPMNGRLTLQSYDAQKRSTDAWSSPLVTEQWFSVVLAIKESKDPAQGYIEFWYNGQPQTLHGGSTRMACRTLDGGYTDPKWGVYHANNNADMTNLVRGLRIGSDYASVDQNTATSMRIPPWRGPDRMRVRAGPADGAPFYDLAGRLLPAGPAATGLQGDADPRRPAAGVYLLKTD